jgi:molybdopterin biosynthesis enzyme MoaB
MEPFILRGNLLVIRGRYGLVRFALRTGGTGPTARETTAAKSASFCNKILTFFE